MVKVHNELHDLNARRGSPSSSILLRCEDVRLLEMLVLNPILVAFKHHKNTNNSREYNAAACDVITLQKFKRRQLLSPFQVQMF